MEKQTGTLYLCATPIGNLEDITLRALRVLREADLIAAEDTRHTRKLLAHYGIGTPLTSFHAHNAAKKTDELLALVRAGKTVAVVSDAGLPGISDPGGDLAARAAGEGLPVVAVPGACAAVTALVVSGLRTDRFVFEGFLPRRGRKKALARLAAEERTIILYEAPHRLLATLEDILAVLGDRRIAVARELTKQFEEVYRGSVAQSLEHFRTRPPRGEITLVVEGARPAKAKDAPDEAGVAAEVQEIEARGTPRAAAMKEVARRRGLTKREVYQVLLKVKEGKDT
ncbi:MAG: 16S rRNA (cytidine(1402)-2'-O)-methyltransferase [Desulfotomaculales bacterium]